MAYFSKQLDFFNAIMIDGAFDRDVLNITDFNSEPLFSFNLETLDIISAPLPSNAALSGGFVASFELSSLLAVNGGDGSNGFIINGVGAGDFSGGSVSSAGDINGDGFDDIVIGAARANPNGIYSGESYVVFGQADGFEASLELSSLNGTNGFVLNGIDARDFNGRSVSSAGDINGDGFDDILIAAGFADPNGSYSGESYVVFGSGSGFGASLDLSSLNGSNGFVINGIDVEDASGSSVSSAGDVNGDGFDDILIGAYYADPNGSRSGESYVVFGQADGFGASLELSTLDGGNGFVINGIDGGDRSGSSVSSAGDVNGDGFDDILIGARFSEPNGSRSGESYVVFGQASGFGASFELSGLNGTNGFVINGIDAGDLSGHSVSSAGDVNGDGFDDIVIGAARANPNGIYSGESYVVFGQASGFGASLELSSLNGTNGFVLNGIDARDFSGRSVSSAGDINGDGFDDILIGANYADPNGNANSGESYVVFGQASGFGASLDLSSLDGSNGFVFNGIDRLDHSGHSVSSAGDVNGDGFDDIIIGARTAEPNGRQSGESYVIYGRADFGRTVQILTPNDDVYVATGAGEVVYGLSGNDDITGTEGSDVLYGEAGNDILSGGTGNDLIEGGLGDDIIDGGDGFDTLSYQDFVVTSGTMGVTVNLTSTAQQDTGEGLDTISGIEMIRGSSFDDVFTSSSSGRRVDARAGDDRLIEMFLDGDIYEGGIGNDSFIYDQLGFGLTFNMVTGDAGFGSIITGFENVLGSDDASVSDNIMGDSADNMIDGRAGDDMLSGGLGDDRLNGGAGADILDGGDGNDLIQGGLGDDIIDGGANNDIAVYNGILSDYYIFNNEDGTYTVIDNVNGNGVDTLTNIENVLIGTELVDLSTILPFTIIDGTPGNDTLIGTDDNDFINGLAGNDILSGLGGDDIINGDDGADRLIGGEGADELNGGAGFDSADYRGALTSIAFDVVTGGTGGEALGDTFSGIERYYLSNFNDVVTGSDANEFFFGEDGNDTINGGGGIDRIDGGDGDDIQRGDGGNDTLYGSAGADQLNGGIGTDVANYGLAASAVELSLAAGGTLGDAAGDTYFGIEIVIGSDFDDVIEGNNSANDLRGGDGDDTLIGLGGNDYFTGGAGADSFDGGDGIDVVSYALATEGVSLTLQTGGADTGTGTSEAIGDSFSSIEWVFGSAFNDVILGDGANNRLEGRGGDDQLFGGDGNDRLLGGDGADSLYGSYGVDTLFGQAGNDQLFGGAGNDFFFGSEGGDLINGGTDFDTVSYLASSSGVIVNLAAGGTGGDAAGDSYVSIERVFGTSFDDSITGSDGNDVLLGNGGSDYLAGGLGNDSLIGGAGTDSYGYNTANGSADVINDFFGGETIFILGGNPAFNSFAELQAIATDAGGNVIFNFGGGNSLTVVGRNIADLSASDFDFGGTPPAGEPLNEPLSDPDAFAADIVDVFDMDALI